jgi:hypothetical protein
MHVITKQAITLLKYKYNPSSVGTDRPPNHYDAVRPVFLRYGLATSLIGYIKSME